MKAQSVLDKKFTFKFNDNILNSKQTYDIEKDEDYVLSNGLPEHYIDKKMLRGEET